MQGYTLDPQTTLVEQQFAVVYAPRRKRDRFPENCVEVVADEAAARSKADASANKFPAIVVGPARSSEGVGLFYLVGWLE